MGEATEVHLDRGAQAVRGLRVRIVEGPDRDRILEHFGERLGVGTSPANELTLTDPAVSHYHLELRCEDGILIKDLGSRNGTFVGDVRVNEAVVPIGTRVRIGGTVLSLLDAPIAPPQTPLPRPDVPAVAMPPYRVARAEALAVFERSYLRRLIEMTGGNASAAARAASMDRPYLLSLLRRHGLR